ncbi:MAG: SIS domain-containing protein [Clostridiales bacterium]|jgi:fructoselysine 6-phosphate deglycase|nr:SIS domain-containing protein [Clostridiales bacterium]
MQAYEIIDSIKESLNGKTPKAVYFIGCGGSMASLYASFYLLKTETKSIATGIFTSGEFVNNPPKMLDNSCICIICSRNATAETVAACHKANESGAFTIGMSGSTDTLMAKSGQYCITYTQWSNGNQAVSLRLVFEILRRFENYEHYDEAMAAYGKIDSVIQRGLEVNKHTALKFAEECKDDDVFYVLGDGTLLATAYIMSTCHLMEMQNKHAVCCHSGEYFHGTFETTDKHIPIVLMMGTGRTRPLGERVRAFLNEYAGKVYIIDTVEFGIDELGKNVSEYFNSVIMITIEREMVYQLSLKTGRSIDERRYMWKFEY